MKSPTHEDLLCPELVSKAPEVDVRMFSFRDEKTDETVFRVVVGERAFEKRISDFSVLLADEHLWYDRDEASVHLIRRLFREAQTKEVIS